MEMRGEIRRGYFVEGLSGMQFALPDAVRMLDEIKSTNQNNELPVVLNACDPANPYGVGIDVPLAELNVESTVKVDSTFTNINPRISRLAGNYIIFTNGEPIVWIENFGLRIFFLSNSKREPTTEMDSITQALLQFINHIRVSYPERVDIVIEYCNNLRPSESDYSEVLRSLGFYRDRVQTMRLDLR